MNMGRINRPRHMRASNLLYITCNQNYLSSNKIILIKLLYEGIKQLIFNHNTLARRIGKGKREQAIYPQVLP